MAAAKKSSWLRDNGLTIALLTLFTISVVGQALTGLANENMELAEHGQPPMPMLPYLGSGAFLSALFENWESEFLQMWAYVMLTAYLFQRGSPESKKPDEAAPQDRDPALDRNRPGAPWPVRVGGVVSVIYSHSLGLMLFLLFVASFALHWMNSLRAHAEEAAQHGQPAPEAAAFLVDPQFWFESFQNWQSEFLSTAVRPAGPLRALGAGAGLLAALGVDPGFGALAGSGVPAAIIVLGGVELLLADDRVFFFPGHGGLLLMMQTKPRP